MRTYEYVKDFVSFEADITEAELLKPKNIVNLHLSLQGRMATGVAKTVENLLAVPDPFELKHGAIPKIRLTGCELWAFNELFLNHQPGLMKPSANTGYRVRCLDLVIPVNIPVTGPALYWSATHATTAGIDTKKLTLVSEYSDVALPQKPLEMLRYNYTPAAADAMLKALDVTLTGDMEALLMYSTTVPVASVDTSSIKKLEVYLDGDLKIRTREWQFYKPVLRLENVAGSATGVIFDKYMMLDFRPEPIPKGTDMRIDIEAGATDAIRLIPILRLS